MREWPTEWPTDAEADKLGARGALQPQVIADLEYDPPGAITEWMMMSTNAAEECPACRTLEDRVDNACAALEGIAATLRILQNEDDVALDLKASLDLLERAVDRTRFDIAQLGEPKPS